jgi:hypothetical protein
VFYATIEVLFHSGDDLLRVTSFRVLRSPQMDLLHVLSNTTPGMEGQFTLLAPSYLTPCTHTRWSLCASLLLVSSGDQLAINYTEPFGYMVGHILISRVLNLSLRGSLWLSYVCVDFRSAVSARTPSRKSHIAIQISNLHARRWTPISRAAVRRFTQEPVTVLDTCKYSRVCAL